MEILKDKLYRAYLLRCWQDEPTAWRFSIEEVRAQPGRTGKPKRKSQQWRVTSLALLLVLGLVALLPGSAYAADGDLDTTFGDPNVNNSVWALALQSDGKVLIGG